MPALPDVPSVLRISSKFQTSPTTYGGYRQFYLYSGSAPSNAVCNTIANDVEAAFAANLNEWMSGDFNLVEIEVIDLSSSTGGVGSWTGLENGSRSGAALTIDTAVNLGFTIARRYRGGHPKVYLPFGVETDLDASKNGWTAALQSGVAGSWSTYDNALLAITESGTTLTQHVNVSYYSGFVVSTNPLTGRARNVPKPRSEPLVDVITGHTVNPIVSQQRRRRTSVS